MHILLKYIFACCGSISRPMNGVNCCCCCLPTRTRPLALSEEKQIFVIWPEPSGLIQVLLGIEFGGIWEYGVVKVSEKQSENDLISDRIMISFKFRVSVAKWGEWNNSDNFKLYWYVLKFLYFRGQSNLIGKLNLIEKYFQQEIMPVKNNIVFNWKQGWKAWKNWLLVLHLLRLILLSRNAL